MHRAHSQSNDSATAGVRSGIKDENNPNAPAWQVTPHLVVAEFFQGNLGQLRLTDEALVLCGELAQGKHAAACCLTGHQITGSDITTSFLRPTMVAGPQCERGRRVLISTEVQKSRTRKLIQAALNLSTHREIWDPLSAAAVVGIAQAVVEGVLTPPRIEARSRGVVQQTASDHRLAELHDERLRSIEHTGDKITVDALRAQIGELSRV